MKASAVRYLVDAGPLIGWLNRRDQWHEWSVQALRLAPDPPKRMTSRTGSNTGSTPGAEMERPQKAQEAKKKDGLVLCLFVLFAAILRDLTGTPWLHDSSLASLRAE